MEHKKVRKSPMLKLKFNPPDRKNKPAKAITTPIKDALSGFFLSIIAEKTGTITTFSPVIKPELDADVVYSPITWSAVPANMNSPIIQPQIIVRLFSFLRFLWNMAVRTNAAIKKRKVIYPYAGR